MFRKIAATIIFLAVVTATAFGAKTVFTDGNPSLGIKGTKVTAAFLNAVNKHYCTGLDVDGDCALAYAADTGAANAYVVTLNPALTQYVIGMPVYFKAANANTGAATLNVNGLGVKNILKNGSEALAPGDIKAGQIIDAKYDGTAFQISNVLFSGMLKSLQVLTSGTVYTPTPGTKSIVVELVGGGGGGGNGATVVSNTCSVGGGGGAGSYAIKRFSGLSGTYGYSVGAGGAAGANGGNTTFTGPGSVTVTAYGGNSGLSSIAAAYFVIAQGGGPGNVPLNGDLNIAGNPGGYGVALYSATTAQVYTCGGAGGASIFGTGATGSQFIAGSTQTGTVGGSYGGGGGGGTTYGLTGLSGSSGRQGVIFVWEYN